MEYTQQFEEDKMEIKKISVDDFRDDMGLMRGFNEDSEVITQLKSVYYNAVVGTIKSIQGDSSITKKDENSNILVFKVNEDIKFQLTLTNRIKYLSIDLHRYVRNNRFEEILSDDFHYHSEVNDECQFSDVEEAIEHINFGKHFRHMLVTLVKEVAKIDN